MKNGIGKWFLATVVLASVVVLGGVVLSMPRAGAVDKSNVDSITIDLPVSCSIEASGYSHRETLNNGMIDWNIGGTDGRDGPDVSDAPTVLKTYCNDKGGYAIYAVGASNNEEGNTDLVGSDGLIPTGTISTNGGSAWAMKLANADETLDMNSTYTARNFADIPNDWVRVAEKESGTVSNETGAVISAFYAAHISGTQSAGTYTGLVKYAIFHPSSTSGPVTINQSYARAGKTKLKVRTDHTIVQEGEEEGELLGSFYAMQDMTSTICNDVTVFGVASQAQLVDSRDGKIYSAVKLKNNIASDVTGFCWMAQNLDFDIDSSKTYSHADTDLGWDAKNFDVNATWTPDTTNGKYNIPWNGSSFSGWSNQNRYPYSADPGDAYYYTTGTSSNESRITLESCQVTHTDCEHYQAGNYYNWTAAIASNDSNSITSGDATTSICPAGWRLPKTSDNEFGNTLYAYNIMEATTGDNIKYQTDGFYNLRAAPLWFVRSGYVNNGTLSYSGSNGIYWSSTVNYINLARYLYFHSGGVYPANFYYRSYGRSIRCIAR